MIALAQRGLIPFHMCYRKGARGLPNLCMERSEEPLPDVGVDHSEINRFQTWKHHRSSYKMLVMALCIKVYHTRLQWGDMTVKSLPNVCELLLPLGACSTRRS